MGIPCDEENQSENTKISRKNDLLLPIQLCISFCNYCKIIVVNKFAANVACISVSRIHFVSELIKVSVLIRSPLGVNPT